MSNIFVPMMTAAGLLKLKCQTCNDTKTILKTGKIK